MATPGEAVAVFSPRGVCDTIEGNLSQPGACSNLQNLIHDAGTPGCFVCRPANTKLIDFTVWSAAVPAGTAGVVTIAYQVGNIIFGLIGITTGTFAGHDYPFAYDTAGAAFLAIAAVILADTPTSQATTGAWVPPQMTLTGVDLVVTHVGFPGGGGAFFGWFDITTPLVPTWNVGNTATNALPSVPIGAGSFNNRTYFLCGSSAYYTDTLTLTMTNSNQSLSIGDYTPLTCVAPLPVSTTSQAIIQGLIVFKLNVIYLITGDPVTMNLGAAQLSNSVGTGAPRSAVSTPRGVKFMANDGVRMVDFLGLLSEPDNDLAVPFINAGVPSRVCAAFNSDIYRICVQNNSVIGTPYQDYWYDFKYQSWSGPHNFRYDVAVPLSNDFVLASNALTKSMWNSFSVQSHAGVGNTFIENGTQLAWIYETPPMDELGNIYANVLLRATMEIAAASGGQTYIFTAQNESGSVLGQGTIMLPAVQILWGAFTWGAALWGAAQAGLLPFTIPFTQAVVFNRVSIKGQGNSSLGVKLGSIHLAYKRLKYLLN